MAESSGGGGGGGGGAGGGMGGGTGTGSASTGVGGASTGSSNTTSPAPPPGLSMEAAAQARSSGVVLEKNNAVGGLDTAGPNSSTEMNAGGGWKQETSPIQTSTQQDGRPVIEQAGGAGQTMKDKGVTTDNAVPKNESQGQLNSMLGNADNKTPQSDAAFKQAEETAKPVEPTKDQNQPTP